MSAEQKLLSAAELQAVAPPMENITTDGPPAMSNETIVSDEAKLTAKGLTVSTDSSLPLGLYRNQVNRTHAVSLYLV
jgi:hypothetical protein